MWRFIDAGFNTGSMNMSIDEALLASKQPVLRFYRWKPACLSLGYFQNINQINKKQCKKLGIDIVRRPTGGNAVLHDKELTYSVIIDESLMPSSIIESYREISKGLIQGLKNLGLNPSMNKNVKKEQKSAICFNDPSWYEILVNKKKIIGSAQKCIKGKILQHGAVLIDADIEKYCSLFNNCNEEMISKVKQRMTSINDELNKNNAGKGKTTNNIGGRRTFFAEKCPRGYSDGATPPPLSANVGGFSYNKKPDNKGEARRGSPPSGCRVGFFQRKNPSKPLLLSGFSDAAGLPNPIKVNYNFVKLAMKKGFEQASDIEFEESALTKEEFKLANKLEKEKYSTKEWNFKL